MKNYRVAHAHDSASRVFWMVWNLQNHTPTAQHDSETSARQEAERLAALHPGQDFYVVMATHRCSTTRPVETIELSEVPF